MKADKRRKKQKQASAIDAIFGGSDSDDGADYDPEAAEEGAGVAADEVDEMEVPSCILMSLKLEELP